MRHIICILLLLGIHSAPLLSQVSEDKQLASQYFQNQEYDKAVVIYQKIYSQSKLPFYYNFYLECLLKTGNYKQAEKIVKKEIKGKKGNPNYLVDLGFVHHTAGDFIKSEQNYEKAIKTLTPDRHQITALANSFLKRKEPDFAIRTYIKGRKILPNYPFYMELANVYARIGDTHKMVEEYLDLLYFSPSRKNQIQGILQHQVFNSPDTKKHNTLKTALIKRVQKNTNNIVFADLLIWLYIQMADYETALKHSISIDKRFKEDGGRIYTLGKLCEENEDFNTAIQCYEYIINKGDLSYYFISSKMQLLHALNEKLLRTEYAEEDLFELEKLYLTTMKEVGKSSQTIQLLRGLARLYAFYLDKLPDATQLLEESINTPGIKQNEAAACKLELADILLFKGEVWEASLLYSQIDKAFKHDPIGHEAKFRNAKLFYFQGQFNWAKSQLDVLKASTSKLIANDALNLSILISDNTVLDTNTQPLFLYATAEMLQFQNKYNQAIILLDSLLKQYPSHTLNDEVYFKKAAIFIKKKNYQKAAQLYEIIISDYSYDILADNAMYALAKLYETRLSNKAKAMELYQELLTNYPGSTFAVYARNSFRKLRGDNLN